MLHTPHTPTYTHRLQVYMPGDYVVKEGDIGRELFFCIRVHNNTQHMHALRT